MERIMSDTITKNTGCPYPKIFRGIKVTSVVTKIGKRASQLRERPITK
jgi:hypothetical protein